MKIESILPLSILLIVNCYLTDLEEYKYLEGHNDEIILRESDSSPQNHNDSICQPFFFRFKFSIKRTVYFDLFEGFNLDQTFPVNNIQYVKSKTFSPGDHNYRANIIYDQSICVDHFSIRVRAVSDVDTIEQYFSMHTKMNLYCDKGGVDSTSIRLEFGNDSTILSYISTQDFISSSFVRFNNKMVIITKFSKNYNKPYLMILNSSNSDEKPYNFITPRNIDSLIPFCNFDNVNYFFSEYTPKIASLKSLSSYIPKPSWGQGEYVQNDYIDRDFFSSILKQRLPFNSGQIGEIATGKQYILIYFDYHEFKYYAFFLKVNEIVYDITNLNGYADCKLYSLN